MKHSPKQFLCYANLRVTKAREDLFGLLAASDQPLTVGEIIERLPEPRPGRPTIYRNLELFIQEGWAESFVGEDLVQRFLHCGTTSHHHHIHCERCQRTAEWEGCTLKEALIQLERQCGFKIIRHQLLIYGLCPKCQKEPAHDQQAATAKG